MRRNESAKNDQYDSNQIAKNDQNDSNQIAKNDQNDSNQIAKNAPPDEYRGCKILALSFRRLDLYPKRHEESKDGTTNMKRNNKQ